MSNTTYLTTRDYFSTYETYSQDIQIFVRKLLNLYINNRYNAVLQVCNSFKILTLTTIYCFIKIY